MELRKLSPSTESLWASSLQKPISTTDIVYSTLGTSGVPHCGEGCLWNAELLVSYGVCCVHRVLELALMESRPELWGKYSYVLNRFQGVLDPGFSKPRIVQTSCFCMISEILEGHSKIQKVGQGILLCNLFQEVFLVMFTKVMLRHYLGVKIQAPLKERD
ncbi:hypothetical protein KP509_04G101800 [Ceratopteris richardii]|uniref:Uncharacterized protein n=1 Tax=Ceratopteris richardii TaxID=49495 RepID=A0A8T2UYM5_CERRI|nr:hypothetical protein KP509_04G101800 [Ceratopteris richardii]